MKVLIVDDEKMLVELIKELLKKELIQCDAVSNGKDAIDFALCGQYDLIILDIMMPKLDGFEVIKQLRQHKLSAPVLFLSAKSDIADKVCGLNLGADDYLTKPFEPLELTARVKALLRRQVDYKGDVIEFSDLKLDKNSLTLYCNSGEVRLANTEFLIMEILMSNPKAVMKKERLIEKVWGWDNEAEYNIAEVYVSFLRKKLAAIKSGITIKAVRGIGYRLLEVKDNDGNK